MVTVKLRVILCILQNLIETIVCRIILCDITDKLFLYGLLHRVDIKWLMPCLSIIARHRSTEHFQRLILWSSGEGIEIHIRCHLSSINDIFHEDVQSVFVLYFFLSLVAITRQDTVEGTCHASCLTTMRFVNNNGKIAVSHFLTECLKNKWELLDGSHHNALSSTQSLAKRITVVGPSHNAFIVDEGKDIIAYLFVQKDTVSHHDRGAEVRCDTIGFLHIHKLKRKPCDGVTLARTSRMLNEVAMSMTIHLRIVNQSVNSLQLVITRPDDLFFLFACILIGLLDDGCKVFKDIA